MFKKKSVNKDSYGYWFILPFVIVFLAFSFYPIINTFLLSFTSARLMNGLEPEFIGFKNFATLFKTEAFVNSVKNTWILWILNFIPQLGFALLLSVLFTSKRLALKFKGTMRSLFYLPNILMPATIASLFFSFFSMYGPVNQVLVRFGVLPQAINYIQSPTVMRALVVFIQWWMWFGQTTIIIMAGMTAIPDSLYESAMIDGATGVKMFSKITLPLLKPILIYTFVTSLVGGLQMFDIPFMLSNGRGDPQGSIMTMNILMHLKRTSAQGDVGAAAAVSVMIFIMSSVCAFLIFFFLQKEKDTN